MKYLLLTLFITVSFVIVSCASGPVFLPGGCVNQRPGDPKSEAEYLECKEKLDTAAEAARDMRKKDDPVMKH